MKKLSNTKAELKNTVSYKKSVYINPFSQGHKDFYRNENNFIFSKAVRFTRK